MRKSRGYKTVLQEAELMSMPPLAVVDFLKRRGSQTRDVARNDPVDADVERALRLRSEPLIDLALARYGCHMEVVAELFRSAEPEGAIRIACLANTALAHEFLPSFPSGLLGSDEATMVGWLESASVDELVALFENPTLSDSFLRNVLERGKGWDGLSEDKLCSIVAILHCNPRMRTPREDDYMDGYAEYSYRSVFNAAWRLAVTAPATNAWAHGLGWLYEQLQPEAFSIDAPLELAARWRVDASDSDEIKMEAERVGQGLLDNKQRVRKGLARLALGKNRQLLPELARHDDVAFRCAAYASGSLTADQIRAGYDKDGELAFNEMVSNEAIWKTSDTRQALHDIAWAAVGADEHSNLTAANQYNWIEKEMRRKHPGWFVDEETASKPEIDGEDLSPATRSDIASLAARMDKQSKGVESAGEALKTLLRRTSWIWWFSLGALAANLKHF